MEHNGVFMVSKHGSYRMLLSQQWFLEANKRGLRYPWDYKPKRPIHEEEVLAVIAGVEVPATKVIYNEASEEEIKAWEAERDEYMRQRDEWTAMKMFHKFGYEIFLDECKTYGLTDAFKNSVFPCESGDLPQCTMFCPIYKDCALREHQEGDGKVNAY